MKKLLVFFLSVILFFSCEREIDLNLRSTASRYVIEGTVSTSPFESLVRITKSIDFNDSNPPPFEDSATVTVYDNATGEEYVYQNFGLGLYFNDSIIGKVGHTYTLNVKIKDQEFVANSTIQPLVTLDSLRQEGIAEPLRFGDPNRTFAKIIPVYKDPPTKGNYYQFVVSRNGFLSGSIYILSDLIFNGTINTSDLQVEARKGDTITVRMQCVEKNIYDYFRTLNQIYPSDGGPPSSVPTNPVSNISNGALGYFKAHTSSRKTIVVK